MTVAARRLVGPVAQYGWVVAIVAVTGLAQVVTLVRLLGPSSWSIVALAQSAAALASALVGLGWMTVGPSAVAMRSREAGGALFAQTLVARGYAFLVGAPVLFAVVALLAPQRGVVAGLLATAGLVPVLGASWYFIGRGRPMTLLARDTIPQVMGVWVGLLLAALFGLNGYVVAVLIGNVAAVVAGIHGVGKDGSLVVADRRLGATIGFVRNHGQGLLASWAGSANSYLPLLLVARVATSGLPAYALTDRLLRSTLTGFSPVVQFLQGWVPSEPRAMLRRSRSAVGWSSILALLVGLALGLCGRPLAELLSGGSIVPGRGLVVAFALASAILVIGQVTALVVLVPLRLTRTLARSTIAGTVVLATTGIPLGVQFGATGVAWSVVACEAVAVSWQVSAVLKSKLGTSE